MGQRLNIEIKRKSDNKILANAYYHWSAFTMPSLTLANDILGNVWSTFRGNEDKSDTFKAIQLLQSTGAGLLEEEYDKLSKEEQKYAKVSLDRNVGLIAFTEKNMEENRQWEEARLTVIVDFEEKNSIIRDNKVDFDVIYAITMEEIKTYYKTELENGEIDLENDIVDLNIDFKNMSSKDITYFMSKIPMIENNIGIFKNNGKLYQIIC